MTQSYTEKNKVTQRKKENIEVLTLRKWEKIMLIANCQLTTAN